MSVQINFHLNNDDKLVARSTSFTQGQSADPFATFEIISGGQSVTVFLRNVEDARRLVDAAVEAYRNVEEIELEKRVEAFARELPVFGGDTVTEAVYNEWIADGGDFT